VSHRSGFASLVGRPNTGKSTLTNALVGEKIAITSARPQTTRHAVRGIVHRDDAQLVLVDTPGLHKPRTLLGERLNAEVRETLASVDLIVFCIPADEKVGPGDRFIAAELAELRRTPVVAVVTKTDLVGKGLLTEQLLAVQRLGTFAEIIPVSAKSGEQVSLLEDLLVGLLPEGPVLYPDGEITDEPEETWIAELVREAALEGLGDELPHSLAVVVDEVAPREDRPATRPLTDVRVSLFVERDSQKAIIIGRSGQRLRVVGSVARHGIEEALGVPIFLDLRVKVAKDWQRDPKQLKRMGF
jgi:GTP-binding protein Era